MKKQCKNPTTSQNQKATRNTRITEPRRTKILRFQKKTTHFIRPSNTLQAMCLFVDNADEQCAGLPLTFKWNSSNNKPQVAKITISLQISPYKSPLHIRVACSVIMSTNLYCPVQYRLVQNPSIMLTFFNASRISCFNMGARRKGTHVPGAFLNRLITKACGGCHCSEYRKKQSLEQERDDVRHLPENLANFSSGIMCPII